VQGPIRKQENNDEHIRLNTKARTQLSTMVNTTPNKKAIKDDHHGEYSVMKGSLRGEEKMFCCGAL
jgi:hypothetical protein